MAQNWAIKGFCLITCTGDYMEIRELIDIIKTLRPWMIFIFCLIAFQSLQNAIPPQLERESVMIVAAK
jgi:hypothetical protein